MSIENKIARLIYPEYRFGTTTVEEGLKLIEMGVGGFCLYGGTLNEVVETLRIFRNASRTPLVFAADYENGVGQWIKEATLLPSNMAIGASDRPDLARRKAEITAMEAEAIGVDWIFAPVVDLATNHSNPIVNLRAFSDSISKTVEFAKSYIAGLDSFNMINSIKHFPGHGDTSSDSHLTLPEIKKSKEELRELELKPFKSLINKADSVMVGHLKINSLDDANITSFSKKTITDLLINELGFKGLIITDALSMKAISDESYAGVSAFLAGADILLVPENPHKLHEALMKALSDEKIKPEMVERALARQDVLVRKRALSKKQTKDVSLVGCEEHRRFVSDFAPYFLARACGAENSLSEKKKVYYFEPMTAESNYKGETFINKLRDYGIEFCNMENAELIIIGSFSKPRAYSGKINMSEEENRAISDIFASGKKIAMVSFGSPFVFDGYIDKIDYGLCCFGDMDELQSAAARVLSGKEKARGTMPVELKSAAREKK